MIEARFRVVLDCSPGVYLTTVQVPDNQRKAGALGSNPKSSPDRQDQRIFRYFRAIGKKAAGVSQCPGLGVIWAQWRCGNAVLPQQRESEPDQPEPFHKLSKYIQASIQVKEAEPRKPVRFQDAALQVLLLQHRQLRRGHFAAVRT